jgi:hypothetical protein
MKYSIRPLLALTVIVALAVLAYIADPLARSLAVKPSPMTEEEAVKRLTSLFEPTLREMQDWTPQDFFDAVV